MSTLRQALVRHHRAIYYSVVALGLGLITLQLNVDVPPAPVTAPAPAPPPVVASDVPASEPAPQLAPPPADVDFAGMPLAAKLQWIATGSGSGLLTLMRQGAASSSLEAQYVATRIMEACDPHLPPASDELSLPTALAQRGESGAVVRAAQEAAAREKKRCDVFLQVPRTEFDKLRADLRERAYVRNRNSPFNGVPALAVPGDAPVNLDLAAAQLRDQLERYGPISLQWLGADLALYAAKAREAGAHPLPAQEWGVKPVPPLVANPSVFVLALCEAGYSCDTPTHESDNLCMGTGACGSGLREAALAGIDPSQREEAKLKAKDIVRAIEHHDWDKLGLGSAAAAPSRNN